MAHTVRAVSEAYLIDLRRKTYQQTSGSRFIRGFVWIWLDVFVWFPLRALARFGLLRARFSTPDNPNGGSAGAGVGARLPVTPPQLSAGAAKTLPPDESA